MVVLIAGPYRGFTAPGFQCDPRFQYLVLVELTQCELELEQVDEFGSRFPDQHCPAVGSAAGTDIHDGLPRCVNGHLSLSRRALPGQVSAGKN
ncbi:hypothetical protein ACFVTM_19635 [Arthrobacter sp. NPDC058130]|uniref:hypothetical protein n=1 Tax=Arthrobacter sp. NPDC058130 TaxID=3346353 RepID=UPI0036E3991B